MGKISRAFSWQKQIEIIIKKIKTEDKGVLYRYPDLTYVRLLFGIYYTSKCVV